MNKLALVLLLLLAPLGASAQQVFQFELDNSARAMRSPGSGYVVVRLATFQHCALNYLATKTADRPDHERNRWLDNQAYYMADFLRLYYMQLIDESLTETDHAIWKQSFATASAQAPEFYDDDNPEACAYVNDRSLTPFSLDTNWEKAFERILQDMMMSPQGSTILRGFKQSATR